MNRRPLHPLALLALVLLAAAAGGSLAHCTPKAVDCRVDFARAPSTPEGGCVPGDGGAD